MKSSPSILVFLFFLFSSSLLFAQTESLSEDPVMDSLKIALKNAQQDTARCSILNKMIVNEGDDNVWPKYNNELKAICERNLKKYSTGDAMYNFYMKYSAASLNNEGYLANIHGDIPKALECFQRSLKMEEETGNKEGVAASLANLGSVYQYQGNIPKALENYLKSLEIRKEIKDIKGIAESLNNLGLLYNEQGDISKSLDCYHQSLSIQEKIGDKEGTAISLNNIGAVYQQHNDFTKALLFYHKSLKLQEQLNDKLIIAGSLHNIGNVYERQGDSEKALEYVKRSYKTAEEIDNVTGMAHCLNSLGVIYEKKGDVAEALKNWRNAMPLWEKINDKQGIALTSNHMARVLLKLGDVNEAQKFAERSLKLSTELGFPASIKSASQTLSEIYTKSGKWKEAYEMQVLYKQMSDSVTNETSRKTFLQKTLQYEYEKKVAADSIKSVGERKVFAAEIRQQKVQRTALYFGIGFIALFALFIYSRFRVTQKQKQIIEHKEKETQEQKHIIEEKHKEISDSINYAERIQRSFLATKELLDVNLKDYFVLYQPKATVSGDFYWADSVKASGTHADLFLLATADSTGHGVPGAIMSLLNITSLEKAIEKFSDPAEILNETRKTIIERLKNDGSEEGGKDGMDCSLVAFDFKNNKLIVSAAQNPVWLIRTEEGKTTLMESNWDKMPVGKHDHDHISFTNQVLEIKKGDMLYAITDGFIDQFGGPKGKKFMQKRLKELLTSIAHETPVKQKSILEGTLKAWIGGLEQVDDITIIGVRIS